MRRFHLSETTLRPEGVASRTVYWRAAEKRRSETSCLVVKAFLGCVPGQSTLAPASNATEISSSRIFRYRKWRSFARTSPFNRDSTLYRARPFVGDHNATITWKGLEEYDRSMLRETRDVTRPTLSFTRVRSRIDFRGVSGAALNRILLRR